MGEYSHLYLQAARKEAGSKPLRRADPDMEVKN